VAPAAQPRRRGRASRRAAPLLPARRGRPARDRPARDRPGRPGRAGRTARTEDQGPPRRSPRRAGPRPDHHPDQPGPAPGPQDVRRYAATGDPGDLCSGTRATRTSLLDPHLPYLHQRWEEGCHSTEQLHAEIRARGYAGSLRTLRRHTAQLRQDTGRPAQPPAPASKKVAAWILTPPGNLPDDNRAALAAITDRCPELDATRTLVRQFADMLTHRQGSKLPAWADQAEASTVQEMRSFAAGLRKDWDAVTAGLTLSWSSGTVEGHVNRIKMLKRQMYGKAKPDLLRKRVLLAD
jgi:hypothetical protein